jgi:cytochrome P450
MEPFEIGPHRFERKSVIIISSFATHRRADLSPEPLTFRPERFLEDAPAPYAFLPFGGGPRVCLGQTFAMLEATIILATMMQHLRLEPLSDRPAELDTLVTLRPRGSIDMRVRKRPQRALGARPDAR